MDSKDSEEEEEDGQVKEEGKWISEKQVQIR